MSLNYIIIIVIIISIKCACVDLSLQKVILVAVFSEILRECRFCWTDSGWFAQGG